MFLPRWLQQVGEAPAAQFISGGLVKELQNLGVCEVLIGAAVRSQPAQKGELAQRKQPQWIQSLQLRIVQIDVANAMAGRGLLGRYLNAEIQPVVGRDLGERPM